MDELRTPELTARCWSIEEYHRALKQCYDVERCQARSARAQRNHIGVAIRAFARLSWHFSTTGIGCYETKRRWELCAGQSGPTDHGLYTDWHQPRNSYFARRRAPRAKEDHG
jgi:hypothetical protein